MQNVLIEHIPPSQKAAPGDDGVFFTENNNNTLG